MFKKIFLLSLIFVFIACNKEKTDLVIEEIKNQDEFGIEIDSMTVSEGIVKNNDNISTILNNYKINQNIINQIVVAANDKYDFTKIRVGHKFLFYSDIDSSKFNNYFVYEIDKTNFLIVNITDSIKVFDFKKDVVVKEKVATGRIDYSLYTTLQNKKIPLSLAVSLADVYAWQIDFYRIMKGDSFKVVYDEKFVDGKSIGTGRIKSAYFSHNKKDYYAFYYKQNDQWSYFDQEGNSLKKQFLKSPLKFTRISSGFTYSRKHPILGRNMPHTGIDYAAPSGTPVQSIGDGVVTFAQYSGAAGNYIKIKHNNNFMSGYMHLSKYGAGIRVGARVSQGQVIGYVGSTGRSTGPHLDFRFWVGNQPRNYLEFEFPPIEPISEKNKTHYASIKNEWIKFLQKVRILDYSKDKKDLNP